MPHTEADQLETTGQWKEAVDYWRRRYADAHDPEAAVRLAFVCWYVLAEHGCIPTMASLTDEDVAEFAATLQGVTADALARYGDDADVLFHIGYMASLFPWYFGSDDAAIGAWERRASVSLRRAHEARPGDPVLEMVHLGNETDVQRPSADYLDACRRARPLVAARYNGAGAFDNYFRQVLTRAA